MLYAHADEIYGLLYRLTNEENHWQEVFSNNPPTDVKFRRYVNEWLLLWAVDNWRGHQTDLDKFCLKFSIKPEEAHSFTAGRHQWRRTSNTETMRNINALFMETTDYNWQCAIQHFVDSYYGIPIVTMGIMQRKLELFKRHRITSGNKVPLAPYYVQVEEGASRRIITAPSYEEAVFIFRQARKRGASAAIEEVAVVGEEEDWQVEMMSPSNSPASALRRALMHESAFLTFLLSEQRTKFGKFRVRILANYIFAKREIIQLNVTDEVVIVVSKDVPDKLWGDSVVYLDAHDIPIVVQTLSKYLFNGKNDINYTIIK